MSRRVWATLLTATAVGACAPAAPERQAIEGAASALGGSAALEALTTLSFEGEGERFNLGQDMTPDATTQSFGISDYRASLNVPARQWHIEQTRTPRFDYFRGSDPIPEVAGLDGDVAYDVAPDASARRAPETTASDRRVEFYLFPLTAVRAALDPAATVSNARTSEGETAVDITTADGVELTLAVDAGSKLPVRVSSRVSHPNLRDVRYQARFESYEDVDGVMVPTRWSLSLDERPLMELALTSYSVNGDVGDLRAPESARSAEPVTGPSPPNVTAEEVASGVWFLAGQSHHSVLVELADHTMLIEAPSEERTLAAIAKARELVPDKPLTHLVSTHHHFDHSGGVRAAISEGLNIITHAANVAFYEELATRSSSIVPDALERNPRAATIEAVSGEATYGDGATTVELYHIEGNPHGDALLMAYLPRQRLLVQADAFSPGRDYQPYARNLLENVRSRDLRVERIVPIHGDVVPFDALVSSVQAMTN